MGAGRAGERARHRRFASVEVMRAAAGALGVALFAMGCARQSAPPGGPPDSRPPVVIRTSPEGLASVPDFQGPVRFEFDERISEQAGGGTLDAAVTISPRTGAVRVSHGRRSLEVSLDGGFRSGVVYRVTLQPVVRDMFGNTLRDPFELVFDTGAEPEETAVAGEIWDRVTGRGVEGAAVHAVGADSLTHVANSGEGGIYALRYVPSGSYALTAFQDQDADGNPDASEVRGTTVFDLAAGDTVFVDVPIMAADTTPAVLLAAEILDSVTVAVRFDDHVDPASDLGAARLEVRSPGGDAVDAEGVFHAAEWVRHVSQVRDSLARADSVARADTLALADTGTAEPDAAPSLETDSADMGVPGDTLDVAAADSVPGVAPEVAQTARRRGPPDLPGGAIPGLEAARARGRVLPGRRIVLVLRQPLAPDEVYTVQTEGVVNLNGLVSGSAEVEAEIPSTGAGGGP